MSKVVSGTVVTAPLAQLDTPLVAVALSQETGVPPSLAEFDRATGGVIARALASADFKGKRDETALLYPAGAAPGRILLVGLGKAADITRRALRRAAAVAGKRARALGVRQFAFAAPPEAREVEAGVRIGNAVAAGHGLARFLQIQPGNVCTPSFLADQARRLGEIHGVAVTVLDRAGLRAEGMGALLAVAQGSAEEPRFIVLQYTGAGDAAPVALVGKGVTFDAGGISIKPAQNMEEMKFDMSGAAAVLGTFEVLGH